MKQRYWYCKKCGKVERRYKNRNEQPDCKICGEFMESSRTTKKANKIRAKYLNNKNKLRIKIRDFKERYYNEVRDMGGRKLRVSKETKKLWKDVNKAKTKPNLIRKGQIWLESLKKDLKNVPKSAFAKRILEDGRIEGVRHGWETPELKLMGIGGSLKGRFRCGLRIGGAFIELYGDNPIQEIKKTLLHEALHYIDDCSETPSYHDCYFYTRLDKLNKMFNKTTILTKSGRFFENGKLYKIK
jgi:hypothetical protein